MTKDMKELIDAGYTEAEAAAIIAEDDDEIAAELIKEYRKDEEDS